MEDGHLLEMIGGLETTGVQIMQACLLLIIGLPFGESEKAVQIWICMGPFEVMRVL